MTKKIGSHSGVLGRGGWATRGVLALGALFLWAAVGARAQGTPSYSVLHTFTGADGEYPQAGLIRDWEGNLYSTAFLGGDLNQCGGTGCGVVFKLDPRNKETVLYTFEGGTDGAGPAMNLLRDQAGNLYSTTHTGGDVGGCTGPGFPSLGCGVVFKVDPRGKESVLHAFSGGADGLGGSSGLVQDGEGNLYGTAIAGGDLTGACTGQPGPGCGVLFRVDPRTGKETVLHTFELADGYGVYGDLLMDQAGNIYGAASLGGDTSGYCGSELVIADTFGGIGCGTVYKLDRSGRFNVLHAFNGTDGGPYPDAWLVPDREGNLYGMTGNGGDLSACGGFGCGVVFKLDRRGNESVLYDFTGGADGSTTFAGVVRDAAGNLYGATAFGGNLSDCGGSGCGVVFKVDPAGKETVLYTFTGGTDGANPQGNLLLDEEGNLYGTTSDGGDPSCQCGVVFKIALHGGEHN